MDAGTLARDQGLALIEQGQYEAGWLRDQQSQSAGYRHPYALANAQAEVVVRLLSQADPWACGGLCRCTGELPTGTGDRAR